MARCNPRAARAALVLLCVLVWFSTSISLTLYNKWLYNSWCADSGGFAFPVFVTTVHMGAKGIFALLLLAFRHCARPRARPSARASSRHARRHDVLRLSRRARAGYASAPDLVESDGAAAHAADAEGGEGALGGGTDREQVDTGATNGKDRQRLNPLPTDVAPRRFLPVVSGRIWLQCAVPIGMSTALDVTCSNLSFLYISVSFYTMLKVLVHRPRSIVRCANPSVGELAGRGVGERSAMHKAVGAHASRAQRINALWQRARARAMRGWCSPCRS